MIEFSIVGSEVIFLSILLLFIIGIYEYFPLKEAVPTPSQTVFAQFLFEF